MLKNEEPGRLSFLDEDDPEAFDLIEDEEEMVDPHAKRLKCVCPACGHEFSGRGKLHYSEPDNSKGEQ